MKTISFVFAIIVALSLINIINANERKQRSTNLFRERFLDLLLEAKRREYLHNKYEQAKKEFQRPDDSRFSDESDEDQYERKYVRRKVVGISDNPF